MCLTAPARLLSIDETAEGSTGFVELDGLRRHASLLLVPDAQPGDWLLVGAGNALRRLEPGEARELSDLIAAASAATATPATATVLPVATTVTTGATAAVTISAPGPAGSTGGRQ